MTILANDKATCRVMRRGDAYAGKQGFEYFAGSSSETVGAQGICTHLLKTPKRDSKLP